jgi:hypothetical protein
LSALPEARWQPLHHGEFVHPRLGLPVLHCHAPEPGGQSAAYLVTAHTSRLGSGPDQFPVDGSGALSLTDSMVVFIVKAAWRDAQNRQQRRLAREAKLLAMLGDEPSVPALLSVPPADNETAVPWIALEYVHGETVESLVLGGRVRVDDDVLLRFAAASWRTLRACHRAGIAHRDFGLHNMLARRAGAGWDLSAPVVIDFGYAFHEHVRLRNEDGSPKRGRSGGYAAEMYLAPGALKAVDATLATERLVDVFQWGVGLWVLRHGDPPYPSADSVPTWLFDRDAAARLYRDLDFTRLPPPLDRAVAKALSWFPEERDEEGIDDLLVPLLGGAASVEHHRAAVAAAEHWRERSRLARIRAEAEAEEVVQLTAELGFERARAAAPVAARPPGHPAPVPGQVWITPSVGAAPPAARRRRERPSAGGQVATLLSGLALVLLGGRFAPPVLADYQAWQQARPCTEAPAADPCIRRVTATVVGRDGSTSSTDDGRDYRLDLRIPGDVDQVFRSAKQELYDRLPVGAPVDLDMWSGQIVSVHSGDLAENNINTPGVNAAAAFTLFTIALEAGIVTAAYGLSGVLCAWCTDRALQEWSNTGAATGAVAGTIVLVATVALTLLGALATPWPLLCLPAAVLWIAQLVVDRPAVTALPSEVR